PILKTTSRGLYARLHESHFLTAFCLCLRIRRAIQIESASDLAPDPEADRACDTLASIAAPVAESFRRGVDALLFCLPLGRHGRRRPGNLLGIAQVIVPDRLELSVQLVDQRHTSGNIQTHDIL